MTIRKKYKNITIEINCLTFGKYFNKFGFYIELDRHEKEYNYIWFCIDLIWFWVDLDIGFRKIKG